MKLGELIRSECERHGVPESIVASIIVQESGGERFAIRYEPGFFNKYIAQKDRGSLVGFVPREKDCNLLTEKHLRAFSYGYMQIMGETARLRGFKGLLGQLYNPSVNIAIGVEYFAHLLRQTGGDIDKALLRWNGGGNVGYPNLVRRWEKSDAAMHVMNSEIQVDI